MKAYKIAVPESKIYEKEKGYPALIPRKEIHELIKAHAEKLGYVLRKGLLSLTAPWIQLDDSGVCTLEYPYNSENFPQYIEISWQSFLKLTPDDVDDNVILSYDDVDKTCRSAMGLKESNEQITTHDRNDKALQESIKLMCNNARDAGYAKGLLSGFLLCFDDNMSIRNIEMLKLCIKNADEFIKQAGNK